MEKTTPRKPKISEIVSIVAHQLKTPITVIKGYLEALISEDCGKINTFQKEYLADALENVKRAAGVVDNLLDVSRIEENRFDLKLEPVSLDKITKGVLIDLSPWLKANNCEVSLEAPKKLPLTLTDRVKVRQVIQNLISNAALYKKGGGEVKITLEQKGENILFACKDNGIGIPKSEFKKVFTKFYRSEKAIEMDPSGSGLGLYINKAIIELSGGKIWFKKNKGPGMTFYFSLPVAET